MDQLNVVGGHVALDLVNTVEPRVPDRSVGREHLNTATELLAWAKRVGMVSDQEGEQVAAAWAESGSDASALTAALEIREATYDVLLAALAGSGATAGSALEVLQRHWAAAVSRATLTLPDAAVHDRLQFGSDPARLIPDRLAHAAVELVRSLEVDHLKTCPLEDGGCGWFFLDRSRNSSRRWCSMEDCGARAKARRLTARRRRARAS